MPWPPGSHWCLVVLFAVGAVYPLTGEAEAGRGAAGGNAVQQLVTLEYENDILADRDGGYTSGLRLGWSSQRELPGWIRATATAFPLFPETAEPILWGVSLGQSIFTPENVADPDFPPDDRPYAGWLGLGFHVAAIQPQRMDRLTLTLGVVGPASGARRTQTYVHQLTGSVEPVGWETQLPNEPTLLVAYDTARRLGHGELGGTGIHWELTPTAGAVLSNAITEAGIGFYHRVGRNIPRDFGPSRIRSVPRGSSLFQPTGNRGWYLFWGLEGRYVAHDMFLDGSLFQDTPRVDKKEWVGELFSGAALQWGRNRLSYTYVARSREFDKQDRFGVYGSLTYTRLFR